MRIEIPGDARAIRDSLTRPAELREWLWPQRFSAGLPDRLQTGNRFSSWFGPIAIEHAIERSDERCLRALLSRSIDGYHEWCWGDGWVQSRFEGISALPLQLANTSSLLRLRAHLRDRHPSKNQS